MDVADEGLACLLPDVGYLSFEESCWLLKNKSIGFNDLIYLDTLLLIKKPLKIVNNRSAWAVASAREITA